MSGVRLPIVKPTAHGAAAPAPTHDPALPWSPRHPAVHAFSSETGRHLLVVDGSRVYTVADDVADRVEELLSGPRAAVERLLEQLGLDAQGFVEPEPPTAFPLRSLSLALAQKCNLGCTYCYAEGGSFGGEAKNMPRAVARAAVDRLFKDAAPGERVHLACLGGEPLVNRPVLIEATEHADRLSRERGVPVGYAITTNGTLLTADDGDFFERFGFAVTVSLDGVGRTHDQQRPFKGGRGSYDQIVARVAPLLARQRRMQVSARVTVTPRNLCLRETLDELIGLGFHSVGFSPLLRSPTGLGEMAYDQLQAMLAQMIDCGREFERRIVRGERYPLANMVSAMQEIHKGTHRPYPCGAGAGYFGVSADGGLFACHRFVDDQDGALGNLTDGVDAAQQRRWLDERHVHHQEPCCSCWARYLCGGGCHHEVMRRGRPACDYIRGWLHYCLQAYVRLLQRRPDYFGQ